VLEVNLFVVTSLVHSYTLPKYTLPQVLQDCFAKAPIRPIDLTAPLIYTPQQFFRGPEQCCGLLCTRCNTVLGAGAVFSHTRQTKLWVNVSVWTSMP